ncbi:MAG: WG repeat-containing protein [Cytophagales bacterium]|nr:WG repeat-containing protein [Cytophagales bacterium]MDW8385221.1 WG repeat-containing protein [Flammeovirgaceae bacterium]
MKNHFIFVFVLLLGWSAAIGQIRKKQVNGLWGLYRKNKAIIQPLFCVLNDSFDTGGLLLAGRQDSSQLLRYGLFDVSGRVILSTEFLEIRKLGYHFYAALPKDADTWKIYQWNASKLQTRLITDGIVDFTEFVREKAILNRYHRYGMIDVQGNTVLPFEYRKIERRFPEYHAYPFAEARLIDAEGKVLKKYFLDSIQPISPNLYCVQLEGKFGVMKPDGSFLFFNMYDSVTEVREPFLVVWKNGKSGLIDTTNRALLDCKFQKITSQPYGLWEVIDSNKRFLFTSEGKNVTAHLDTFTSFSEGYLTASYQSRWGLLDSNLHWKILPAYQAMSSVKDGFVAFKMNELYGIMSVENELIISPYVDSIAIINRHLFIYHDNQGWGTLQPNGKDYFFSYGSYEILPEGTIRFRNDSGLYGLLDNRGRLLLPAQYDFICATSQKGLYQTHKNFKKGFAWIHDVEREVSKDSAFLDIEVLQPLGEKFIPVRIHRKYGFTDHTGRIKIATRYDSVQYFSQGRAAFKLAGKWGFLDEQENIIVQPIYEKVFPYTVHRVSLVCDEGKWGLLSEDGKPIVAIEYDKLSENEFGNWICEIKNKKGLISADGMRQIFPQFDDIRDIGNGFAIVRKRDKYGVYHLNGYAVIFPEWEAIIPNFGGNTFFVLRNRQMEILR